MNKDFWKAAGIRAIRTMIQTILAVWTAGTVITDVDWKTTILATVSAGIYSLLTSILAGLPESKRADIELTEEEVQDAELEAEEKEAEHE